MATLLTLLFTFPRSTSPGSESGSRSLASMTGMHNPPGRSDLSLLASDKHVLPVARRPPPHLRLRRCSHASPHKTKMGGATAERTQKRQYSGTTVRSRALIVAKAKLEETEMDWLFELDGEASDKLALRPLASACNCTIRPGPDAMLWLGGTKFDGMTTPEQALEDSMKTLVRLNGLARLENPQHRTVSLGNAYLQNQILHYIKPPSRPRIPRSEVYEYSSPLTGGHFVPPVDPADDRRRARIAADPKLAEILEVFADEITWQRQRVAFEKINALVGNGDNALVENGYATQSELTRFKANAQDPRHSGHEAVHGVARGPLKGTKMTEREGFDFIVRLFNTYVARQLK